MASGINEVSRGLDGTAAGTRTSLLPSLFVDLDRPGYLRPTPSYRKMHNPAVPAFELLCEALASAA